MTPQRWHHLDMDAARFHRLRLAVQENAFPAETSEAGDLERTLEGELRESPLFDQVEVGRTSDPDQLIIALCRCAPGVLPWEAAHGLERLWRWAIGDPTWEAHAVSSTDSVMDFEGALTLEDGRHYLTVHVVAERTQPGGLAGRVAAAQGD
jgi:hypothetical protein